MCDDEKMNFVYLSPHFPPNYYRFCVRLREEGVNVLGLADASWESRDDGGSLLVSSRVTLKKPLLTHAEIASQAFADLQKGIRQCFGDYALVFEPQAEK